MTNANFDAMFVFTINNVSYDCFDGATCDDFKTYGVPSTFTITRDDIRDCDNDIVAQRIDV